MGDGGQGMRAEGQRQGPRGREPRAKKNQEQNFNYGKFGGIHNEGNSPGEIF